MQLQLQGQGPAPCGGTAGVLQLQRGLEAVQGGCAANKPAALSTFTAPCPHLYCQIPKVSRLALVVDEDTARFMFRQLVLGLQHLHDSHVAHRWAALLRWLSGCGWVGGWGGGGWGGGHASDGS